MGTDVDMHPGADIERHHYDVLVIGAGGAGMRAAIAAAENGARTGLVCKSLLGKAHTVMAEGGIAAALGNVAPEDNWKVHFQDTMFSAKYLNNWHMAELHAREAPDRVRELEQWGGIFDRTPDRRMDQRAFGGHTHRRLAQISDRTELVADDGGLGLCNITKCCSEVCPEGIHITDNAIIPLKERRVDRRYDPLAKLVRKLFGRGQRGGHPPPDA